jgi:hypothetical protein
MHVRYHSQIRFMWKLGCLLIRHVLDFLIAWDLNVIYVGQQAASVGTSSNKEGCLHFNRNIMFSLLLLAQGILIFAMVPTLVTFKHVTFMYRLAIVL